MSSKVVRMRCLGVGGTTTVNLDRCQEFSIGPPIIPGELPVDRSQYGIYYLTPDLRWVAECHISPDRVYYEETTRNAVRNHAFRVGHYPLPRELQTEHYSDKEKTPPPSLRPSRPGVPMVTFNLDPEEIRQFRGVSHGTVKSVDEEMTAGPPPRENEQPAAVDASRTVTPDDLARATPNKLRLIDARDAVPWELPCEGSDGRRIVIQIGAKPLRFGCMSLLLRGMMELSKQAAQTPTIQNAFARCVALLWFDPGFMRFREWSNIEFGREPGEDTALELQKRLCQKLRVPFRKISMMPVVEVMGLVHELEAVGTDTANRRLSGSEPAAGLPEAAEEKPAAAPASGTVTPEVTSPRMSRKEPKAKAIAAYRAVKILGQKQEDVAPKLGVSQGTISRWIDRVSDWIAAGNILPDLDAPKRKPIAMDPQKLEQGPNPRRARKSENMRDASR
jgi:hypothetical protein